MAPTTETTEKAKFVAPPKPATKPDSLNIDDYGYKNDKGEFKFWQGYDAAYKSNLMKASRSLPANNPRARKARKLLVDAGWSTEAKETAAVEAAKAKAQAVVDRAKAKAERAKESAKKKAERAAAKQAAKDAETEDAPEAPESTDDAPEDGTDSE